MSGFTIGPMQDPEREARRQERFAKWDAERQDRQSTFMAAFRVASQEDPELVGESRRAAEKLGVDPKLAELNIDVARQVMKERALRQVQLRNENPVLMKHLGRTEFLRVAHDDLDNLRSTETTFEMLGRNWDKGQLTNELGYIGLRQAMGRATEDEARRAEEIDMLLGDQRPGDDGFAAATAEVLGQMSETAPIAMASGAAAAGAASLGGPVSAGAAFTVGAGAATFTLSGAIGAGHAYRGMIRRGIPHERAAVFAFGAGAFEGGLETLGQTVAIGPFRKAFARGLAKGAAKTAAGAAASSSFARFVADYAKTFTAEVGTELAQTATGAAVEEVAATGVERAKPAEDLGDALMQTFDKTGKAMAVLSLPGPGLAFMADVAAAERTQAATQALNKIQKEAEASLVKDRDPAAYSAAVTDMAKKVGDGNVYVNAPTVIEAFRQGDKAEAEAGNLSKSLAEQAEEAMPGFSARLEEAARRGDDLAIPVGEWAGKLANSNAGKALAPHVRVEASGLSPDEAKRVAATPEDAAKEAEKLATDEVQRAEQWDKEADDIERTLREQVVAAGRPKADAARGSRLWRAAVETIADRVGETPAEFWGKYGVKVQKDETQAGMQQGEERGSFDPASRVIRLSPDADFSTFAHESGHAFLDIYEHLAAQKAHPQVLDDFRTFLKWAGEDEAAWAGKTLEQKRKAHENFAANFEAYLLDGNAPEPGLRRLFAAFSRFIKRVYGLFTRQRLEAAHEAEFGEALLPLSDDIRTVMDRMLASDEKVRTTLAIRGAVPVFESQEESGLDDAAWGEYLRRQKEADDAAVSDIERAAARDTRLLGARVAKLRGDIAKEAKRVREGVRQTVAQETEATPLYRTVRWLRTGELLDENGKKQPHSGPHKILTDDVPEALREKLRGMTSQDGLPADMVAAMTGASDSGKGLVELLAVAPDIADVIERETDVRMMRDHAKLADPRAVEEAVERALHNETRRRFVASELRELTKVGESTRVMLASAKVQAEAALLRKRVGEINPRAFTMAARRASKQAQEAMAKGDVRTAIEAKRRHLLQEAMADVAADIPKEIEKAEALFTKFNEADADAGKRRVIDYVYAGRALAAAYGFRPKPVLGTQEADLIDRGIDTVAKESPALWERLAPLIRPLQGVPREWQRVSLAEFREAVDVAEWLMTAGREAALLNAEGKRIAMEAAVADLGGEIDARGPRTAPGAAPPVGSTPSGPGRALLKVWNVLAGLKRMEHWARFMDGGKEGAFYRFFVAPISRALTTYRSHQRALVQEYHDALTKLRDASGTTWESRIESADLGFTFKGKKELIGALLHAGTESNLSKLLIGRGWGEMTTVGDAEVLDTRRWDAAVAKLWKDGTLTKADADFLRTVWGIYAKLLPQAQKAHKALYGSEFETIEHRRMPTPFGELRGGYVPARIDRDAATLDTRKQLDTIDGAENAFRYSIGTGKGFTLKRNPFYNQPLDLDLGRQLGHFDSELRFIYLQPVVRDAVRITKNRTFRNAIDAYDREAVTGIIEPWLENVAMQTTSRPSKMPLVDWAATVLRNAASVAALGLNVANALVQVTGISNAVSQVKGSFMRSALATYTKNPLEAGRVARGKSAFMQQRADVQVRMWREDIDRIVEPGATKKAKQTIQRWAFAPQRYVQGVADVVTWHGGYAQAIAEGMAETEAIEAADAAVRRSQGSQNAEDSAAYESLPFAKLFTQFGSYSNLVLNQVLSAQGLGGKLGAAAWVLLLPAIAESSLRLVFGKPEDEDSDGMVDEWFAHYGGGIARNVAGMIPIAGPMALALAQSDGARVLQAPASMLLGGAYRGFLELGEFAVDGDATAAEVRAMATALTVITGLPIAAPVRQVQQLTGTDGR